MSEPFLGMIQFFAFGYAPKYYFTCAGQLLPINQYQALFALLGTTYGGNGTSTFALPNLQGRTPLGYSNNLPIGTMQGTENATLNLNSMPIHSHQPTTVSMAANTTADGNDPTNTYPAAPDNRGSMYATTAGANQFFGTTIVSVGATGSNVPFSILSPYLALNCCIAYQGLFPSRN